MMMVTSPIVSRMSTVPLSVDYHVGFSVAEICPIVAQSAGANFEHARSLLKLRIVLTKKLSSRKLSPGLFLGGLCCRQISSNKVFGAPGSKVKLGSADGGSCRSAGRRLSQTSLHADQNSICCEWVYV